MNVVYVTDKPIKINILDKNKNDSDYNNNNMDYP